MNHTPSQPFSALSATCHNTGIGHTSETSIERAGTSVLGTFHKAAVPIPAVVDNGETLIPLTNKGVVVAFAKVDAADAPALERFRWRLYDRAAQNLPSYAFRVYGTRPSITVSMHRQILGLETGNPWHVDHINGDGLDNRRVNLRRVTRGENMQNYRRVQSRNGTGYRGVRVQRGRFTAQAVLRKQLHRLGTFDTVEEAARAVCEWRAEHMPFSNNCGLPECREGEGELVHA